jgi:tetratricopeptide (TPR) repeat protein
MSSARCGAVHSMKGNTFQAVGRISLLIFCCALAVRFLFLVEISRSPFFAYHGLDSHEYHAMALALLDGTWPGPVPFARPPLYPVFLALLYAVLGSGLFTIRLIHAAIGAANCVLVFRIARSLFRGRFVPLAAAAICCLHGTLVYLDAQLLPTALDSFLLLLAVLALLRAGERRRPAWWLVPGLCIGLGAINRGVILLFLPVAAVWMIGILRRAWPVGTPASRATDKAPPALVATSFAALVLPVVLLIVPVAMHNARYDVPPRAPLSVSAGATENTASRLFHGSFVVLAANGGLNFYLGNHWSLREINDPNHPLHFKTYDSIQFAPLRERRIFSTAESESFLVGRTLRRIRDGPADYLKLLGRKITRLVNGSEIARNSNLYAYRQDSILLRVLLWKAWLAFPNGLLLPLAFVGIALGRRSWRPHFPLLGAIAAPSVLMIVFFVTARYRAPMLLLLAIFAAYAVETLVARWREGGRAVLYAPLSGLLVAAVVCNLPGVAVRKEHAVYERVNLGFMLAEDGRFQDALAQFETAVRIEPTSPEAYGALALARKGQGRIDEAMRLYADALRSYPDDADTLNDLALTLLQMGRPAEAEPHLRLALRQRPENAEIRANLGALLVKRGRVDDGVRELREALGYDSRCILAYSNLGAAYEMAGRLGEAITVYEAWLRAAPGDADARSRMQSVRRRVEGR